MTDLPELPEGARGDLEEAVKLMEENSPAYIQALQRECMRVLGTSIRRFALLGFQVAAAEVERRRREGK